MKEEIKKFLVDKALSIIFTLLSSLIISLAGHYYGFRKFNEASNDRDKYRHQRDSLKVEAINRKYGD